MFNNAVKESVAAYELLKNQLVNVRDKGHHQVSQSGKRDVPGVGCMDDGTLLWRDKRVVITKHRCHRNRPAVVALFW